MIWREIILGEVTDNFDSLRKPVKGLDRKSGPYPYYGASGIVDYVDDFIFDGEYLLIAEDGENLRTRNTPIAFIATGRYWVNNHAHIVRGNEKANTKYLAYALQATDISGYLTGSTMPKLTKGNMNQIRLRLPEIHEQNRIVEILSVIDEKIENNQRMNETLEEMGRAIFKSWFIDFDPVHAKAAGKAPMNMNAETAALFPNSFCDAGRPIGGSVKTLGDLILPKRGKTITKSKTKSGTIPVVAGGLEPAYYHNEANVESPVITISASGANAGFTRLYYENIWASDCSYISKQQTDTIYFWFVFLETNQRKIYHMQQGAAQPHIYPSDLMRLELAVPNNKLIQHFENLVTPYFQKISIAQKESKTLTELRDTLLPKLMSGEIRVKDAENKVEAAV